jgi:hypothetical protein
VQDRHQGVGDREGDRCRADAREPAERLQHRPEELGDGGLAGQAEADAAQRDAELAGREVGIDVLDGVAQGPGAADPVGLQLGDLGRADPGDGELGRHEEEVAGDQDNDQGKLNEHRTGLPAGRPRHTVGPGVGRLPAPPPPRLGQLGLATPVDFSRADAGDRDAARRLAELLAEQGRTDDAIDLFRAHADAGDQDAGERLADLLAEQGRIDELRAEVDAGTRTAGGQLLALLG